MPECPICNRSLPRNAKVQCTECGVRLEWCGEGGRYVPESAGGCEWSESCVKHGCFFDFSVNNCIVGKCPHFKLPKRYYPNSDPGWAPITEAGAVQNIEENRQATAQIRQYLREHPEILGKFKNPARALGD